MKKIRKELIKIRLYVDYTERNHGVNAITDSWLFPFLEKADKIYRNFLDNKSDKNKIHNEISMLKSKIHSLKTMKKRIAFWRLLKKEKIDGKIDDNNNLIAVCDYILGKRETSPLDKLIRLDVIGYTNLSKDLENETNTT